MYHPLMLLEGLTMHIICLAWSARCQRKHGLLLRYIESWPQRAAHPEMPITTAGSRLPSLSRNQLPASALSSASSSRSCCRIGMPLSRSTRTCAYKRTPHPVVAITCAAYLLHEALLPLYSGSFMAHCSVSRSVVHVHGPGASVDHRRALVAGICSQLGAAS